MATPVCVCVCVRERERGGDVCECALSCADQAVHAARRPGLTAGIQPPDVSSFYLQHHSITRYIPEILAHQSCLEHSCAALACGKYTNKWLLR